MVLTYSSDHPLGWKLPAFELNDATGKAFSDQTLIGPHGLLLIFGCNHCPYMKAQWGRIIALANHAKPLGINTVVINSNINPQYPDDAAERMPEVIQNLGIPCPYLVDEKQQVARAFNAQCTPDPFLFNGRGELVYQGRIDDNWQDAAAATRPDLQLAIDALAAGNEISTPQHPSMGCSIKWCS